MQFVFRGLGMGILILSTMSACTTVKPKDVTQTKSSELLALNSTLPSIAPQESAVIANPILTDTATSIQSIDALSVATSNFQANTTQRKNTVSTNKSLKFKSNQSFTPYSVTGQASWYGRQFHGRKTASGERYDMYALSAAHPTLPIPSYARVTNISNGKSVIVRVNDRGPFVKGRVMDLSFAAAQQLDFIHAGKAQVKIERIMAQADSKVLVAQHTTKP